MGAHESTEPLHEVPRPSERAFGIVFAGLFLLVAAWPLAFGEARVQLWAVALALAFGAVALFAPSRLAPLNRLWFRFGMLLHAVVSPVVLGAMFYLVIVPFGLALRLMGKDLLGLRWDSQAKTYWIRRDPAGPHADSFRDQF
jgi:hypothetical protein